MDLKEILELLEEEFNNIIEIFKTEKWKFYKFGQGGPYKRTLTRLQRKANEHDKKIFTSFGQSGEIATFGGLIIICLNTINGLPKDIQKQTSTFRRQIQRMKRQL